MNDARTIAAVLLALSLLGGCDSADDATPDSGSRADAGGTTRTDAGRRNDAGSAQSVDAGADAGRDAGTPTPPGPDRVATAMIAEAEGDTNITGTVRFEQRGTSVTVIYDITSCPDGRHGTHIHAGNGCADRNAQGAHWGPTRGEGIPELNCSGGVGRLMYTRDARDPDLAWTIGGGGESDIVGHPVVIHGASNPSDRIGCGVIRQ